MRLGFSAEAASVRRAVSRLGSWVSASRLLHAAALVLAITGCSGTNYHLGGTVVGMRGSGLVLQNFLVDDLPVSGNGPFQFSRSYPFAYPYSVSVKTQPRNPNQSCAVTNGLGRLIRDISDVVVDCTNTYPIGFTVTGLSGTGLTLQNNSTDDIKITTNGNFRFATEIVDGQTYQVTITGQPTGQVCHVVDGSGTVSGARISNVLIDCGTRTVSGTITGLVGTVVLQNNGGDDLTVAVSGGFAFATKLYDGATYGVTVATQPQGQRCVVSNGNGTVSGDITSVSINCGFTISGSVSGLVGSLVLQNNGGDDLTISVDRAFVFASTLANGATYNVTVKSAPDRQSCIVANGSGVISSAPVDNVTVTCRFGPTISFSYGIKQVILTWGRVGGTSFYRVFKSGDGGQNFIQIPDADTVIPATDPTSYTDTVPVHLTVWGDTRYKVQSCRGTVQSPVCDDSNTVSGLNSVGAIGYLKASNTQAGDRFGDAVAVSGDGDTVAIGAPFEDSAATDVNGTNPGASDNSAADSGAVYVVTRDPATGQWVRQAYVKASNTRASAQFGSAVALSNDGSTLVVGSPGESSAAVGVNPQGPIDQTDTSAPNAGAAYVFTRTDAVWTQEAYVKASNTDAGDQFGFAVAVSRDGNVLAVGAVGESSASTGIDPPGPVNQNDNNAPNAGAVYTFSRAGNAWTQEAYIKASDTTTADRFGSAVALSSLGGTLAAGAPGRGSSRGAAYVYVFSGGAWSQQQGPILASNADPGDSFGQSIALSQDGNTLAAGAPGEASGNPDDETDNSAPDSGAAYVFVRANGAWSQQKYVKTIFVQPGDRLGVAVSLSGTGNLLAAGSEAESSDTVGVGGLPNLNDPQSGAVRIFTRDNSANWSETGFVKASNTGSGDNFGHAVSVSDSGLTMVAGAPLEDSSATTIGGDQLNDAAPDSGAAYLY